MQTIDLPICVQPKL